MARDPIPVMVPTKKNGKVVGEVKRYVAAYYVKGREVRHIHKLRKDAVAELNAHWAAVDAGGTIDPAGGKMLMSDWWADYTLRQPWTGSTPERKESTYRLYIGPTFGHLRLDQIEKHAIEHWVAAMHRGGLDPSTVQLYWQMLKAALADAVDKKKIPANEAKDVKLPKIDKADFYILTVEEVMELADAIKPEYRAIVMTAAQTGLRVSECTALRRSSVTRWITDADDDDLDDPAFLKVIEQAHFTGSLKDENGKRIRPTMSFAPPKSDNGKRTIALLPSTVTELRRHLEQWPIGPHDLLFHSRGRGWTRNMVGKELVTARERVGLPREVTFHSLRHHHATVLLRAGNNPKAVADRLGDDLETFLKTYAHVMPGDDRAMLVTLRAAYQEPTAKILRRLAVVDDA